MKRVPGGRLLLSLWLLATLAPGCESQPQRPEVYPVTGHLTINGQPAAGALLSLHPADGHDFDQRGSRPWAVVQPDGSFAVSTYGEADGAPAGEYRVSVVWLDNPDAASPVDKLGGRYAKPEQSQWRVQIVAGQPNELQPHHIDGVTQRPGGPAARAERSIEPPG